MSYKDQLGVIKASPENYIDQDLIMQVTQKGLNDDRRGFLRKSFASALGAVASSGLVG